jgi:hypothetical protein
LLPGSSGIGFCTMICSAVCAGDEGQVHREGPPARHAQGQVRQEGRGAVLAWRGDLVQSVVDLLLDIAELHHRQAITMIISTTDCAAELPRSMRLEAVVVDLVDQDGGVLARAAEVDGVDDGEGVEERVDDVDDQQEEGGRR